MSKIKYLQQTDLTRLIRVLRDSAEGLPMALQETKPQSYAEALDTTCDDRILMKLSAYIKSHKPSCLMPDEYQNIHKISNIVKYINVGDTVLDFGGGHGFITSELATRCNLPFIWLIDQYEIQIKDPRIIAHCITKRDFALYGLPFTSGFFDITLCFMVLHHIENPAEYIAELTRCTKKYLIIHEHNCETLADKYLLDLVHGLYMYVWKVSDYDHTERFSQFVAWYRKKNYFDQLLTRNFHLVEQWTTNRITKNYMQVWRKK